MANQEQLGIAPLRPAEDGTPPPVGGGWEGVVNNEWDRGEMSWQIKNSLRLTITVPYFEIDLVNRVPVEWSLCDGEHAEDKQWYSVSYNP